MAKPMDLPLLCLVAITLPADQKKKRSHNFAYLCKVGDTSILQMLQRQISLIVQPHGKENFLVALTKNKTISNHTNFVYGFPFRERVVLCRWVGGAINLQIMYFCHF